MNPLPERHLNRLIILTLNAGYLGVRWTRRAVIPLFVVCAFPLAASAIRNGVSESDFQYNGIGMFLPTAGHPLGTGIIVSQSVVLTAAQNVSDPSPVPVFEFTLGYGMTARATEVRRHPEFDTIDGINLAFDVALVALDRDEVRNWPGITRPAILDFQAPVANPAIGVGFGENHTGMGIGKKRSGSFSVNSYLDGADPFGNPIPNAFIEAVPGNALNQCMCWGDQGGPLFYKGKIAGLASFRFVATCDEEGPGYYLSLHRFTDWIRDNLLDMDPISGDYSGNGSVGSEDYDIWKTNFGSSNLAADGNRNGIVDAADYVIWRQNLGAALGVGGSDMPTTRAVPEPASIPLLGAAVVFLSITFAMRLRTFEVHR